MSGALLLANLLATLCMVVIVGRAVGVLAGMDHTTRTVSHMRWLAFGLSYLTLALAAIGSTWIIWQGKCTLGDYGWLAASSGLILFDRRPRRKPWRDPEATVPLRTPQ